MSKASIERPKKRWVKRTALAVCASVWLVVSYVLSFGAYNWYSGRLVRNALSTQAPPPRSNIVYVLDRVFHPVHLYELSGWPGSRFVTQWGLWCLLKGEDVEITWEQIGTDLVPD
jgi:hypothetical protein